MMSFSQKYCTGWNYPLYPTYISPPYLWPGENFDALFSDLPYNISFLVQTDDEGIVKGFR